MDLKFWLCRQFSVATTKAVTILNPSFVIYQVVMMVLTLGSVVGIRNNRCKITKCLI